MGYPIVFVTLPDSLNGDPYQPNSVESRGDTITVSTADLSGDEATDLTLDPQIIAATTLIATLAPQEKVLKAAIKNSYLRYFWN